MLSSEEINDIHYQLKHIPSSFTDTQKKNYERTFNKKLKEHKYASTYLPFQSSPYELIFINRTTTERTLLKIINIINDSNLFTLDTESTIIPHQPNKPSLIQIQIIHSQNFSFIIFVEVCYLPRSDQPQFILIKNIFNSLFKPNNKVYIWGNINELIEFTRYQLFNLDQMYLSKNINVQDKFKKYWIKNYPHSSTSSSNDTSICECKRCFGIHHDQLISIQDAVAFELHRWIDKRLTCQPFDIGLDPKLQRLNDKQMEYRQSICTYAANDCDAIYQLIISTNIINEPDEEINTTEITTTSSTNKFFQPPQPLINELEFISSDDDDDEIMFSQLTPSIERLKNDQTLNINKQEQLISNFKYGNSNWKITSTNENQSTNQPTHERKQRTQPTHERKQRTQPTHEREREHKTQQLSPEERKRIHNRSCTLKQRLRYFKDEIIIKNIDKRFKPREIKDILRYKKVLFFAVNTYTSPHTNERTLFIGIREKTKLAEYKNKTKHLFTSSHFRQFQRMKYQAKYPHRKNRNNTYQRYHQN